jgi:hypothetical protein
MSRPTLPAERPLLICGSPRSGTTWLNQIFSSAPDILSITEPLHLRSARLRDTGFLWRTHREADADWPAGRRFFDALFKGRFLPFDVLVANRPWNMWRIQKVVVKCVRANRLIPWLSVNFPELAIIHLIRHPCAVVGSQSHYWSDLEGIADHDMDWVRRYKPDLSDYVSRLDNFQSRALMWSLDQYIPLQHSGSQAWSTVFYEDLVMDGTNEVTRICRELNISLDQTAKEFLHQNSREWKSDSVDHTTAEATERLGRWRKLLTRDQVKRILDVTSRMGISFYSEELLPDKGALRKMLTRVRNDGGNAEISAS